MVKNLPANARDSGDSGSIPVSGRSPGGGNGNLLLFSCLGNPMDRGAWQNPWRHKESDTTEHTHTHHGLWLFTSVFQISFLLIFN